MKIINMNTNEFLDLVEKYSEFKANEKKVIEVSSSEIESDLTNMTKYDFFNKYLYNISKIIISE